MPNGNVLTPKEASRIAANAYFTLKDVVHEEAVPGVETRAVVQNRVLGAGNIGKAGPTDSSLKGTGLAGASLGHVHSARTGLGISSGFGYTLSYQSAGRKHVILATRGTTLGIDWLTNLDAGATSFPGCGPVHEGFKTTFESILPNLLRDRTLLSDADYIHCVGHSLGGAIATLIAGHFAGSGKKVKLYTFGSPRVGALHTHEALERRIGKRNIYRVAHDLDPVTLLAPYPYIHVLPTPEEPNNMTLLSPTGRLFSAKNHDMAAYISSMGDWPWTDVRKKAALVDHDNALLARWLMHDDNIPAWVQYASEKTLSLLFKLFDYVLRGLSIAQRLRLSAIDLLSEILVEGLHRMKQLGEQVLHLLRYAATWAGIQVREAADFTAEIIRGILGKMISSLHALATQSLGIVSRNIVPVATGLGAWALSSYGAI